MPFAFESHESAQTAVDDWVRRNSPSSTARDLVQFEREHLELFGERYGRLHIQFDVAFDQLVAVVEQVNYVEKSSWPQHRALQYILLSHNLKAFISAMDRLSKGYYEDSAVLSRTLYETFLRAIFISCHRDDPWGAFPVPSPKGTPKFNATNFARDVLRLDWHPIYSTMSAVAHSNFPRVGSSLHRIENRIGDPEVFGLSFEDDPKTLEFAAAFLPFLLAAYSRLVVERFVGDATVRNPDQLEKARESIEWMSFMLSTNEKAIWQRAAVDLDYLFDLLDVADSGGNWRAVAELRPTVTK